MDKLKNRIKYYLIGLSLGVIVVYFMFGNRGCAWLPGNRVKNMIGEKEIIAGDSILQALKCYDLNNDDIYALLKSEGNVEFTLSSTDTYPKVYYIKGEKENEMYWINFSLYDDKDFSEVVGVGRANQSDCDVKNSNQRKSTIPLPHKDVIAILESQEFRVLNQARCEQEFYQIGEENLLKFHKTATIEIDQSAPRLSPNPFYFLAGEINDEHYRIKYIVGENRTRIARIIGKEKSDCSLELNE